MRVEQLYLCPGVLLLPSAFTGNLSQDREAWKLLTSTNVGQPPPPPSSLVAMLPFRTLKFHFHSSISMGRVDVLKTINLPRSENGENGRK